MSRTEELIAKAQQGDREASEALVEENSGLIWSVARRFLGRGTEADDLYQLGSTLATGRSFPPTPCRKLPGRSGGSSGTTGR